jgi:hypothetical protein
MALAQEMLQKIEVEKRVLWRVLTTLREYEWSGDCFVAHNPFCTIPLPAVTNMGGWHWHCPDCGAMAMQGGAVGPHHPSCGLWDSIRALSRLLEPQEPGPELEPS